MNSALQRARATLDATEVADTDPLGCRSTRSSEALLARYVDAFERYDMESLDALLQRGRDASRCRRTTCGCAAATTS